jgi:hypothetical protein
MRSGSANRKMATPSARQREISRIDHVAAFTVEWVILPAASDYCDCLPL